VSKISPPPLTHLVPLKVVKEKGKRRERREKKREGRNVESQRKGEGYTPLLLVVASLPLLLLDAREVGCDKVGKKKRGESKGGVRKNLQGINEKCGFVAPFRLMFYLLSNSEGEEKKGEKRGEGRKEKPLRGRKGEGGKKDVRSLRPFSLFSRRITLSKKKKEKRRNLGGRGKGKPDFFKFHFSRVRDGEGRGKGGKEGTGKNHQGEKENSTRRRCGWNHHFTFYAHSQRKEDKRGKEREKRVR